MKGIILQENWFNRDTVIVAHDLIGKYLVINTTQGEKGYMITETEAYIGPEDKACHAHKGRTKRTEVMFGPPGHWYVYLIYGMYIMLNIVTREEGFPAAVLIRGIEGFNGPGKLTRALSITRDFNTKPAHIKTRLWIEDRGTIISNDDMLITPRIGIDYAGKEWRNKPFRFVLK